MRFTSILFAALPLLGSVFAAPAPVIDDLHKLSLRSHANEIEQRCASGWCGGPINGVDGVVAIFTDIKAQLDVVLQTKITAKAEATVALDAIVKTCTSAYTAIYADVDLKAKLAVLTGVQKKLVAKVMADVMVDINLILASLDAALAADVEIKAHISSCNDISTKLFLSIEACISGVIQLALNICVSLGVKISPLFTCLTVSLNAFLGGVLNLKGLLGAKGLLGLGL